VYKRQLKGKWAIDPQFALNSMPFVSDLISGKIEIDDEVPEQNIEEPSGKVMVINLKGPLMKDDQECGPAGMATIGEYIKKADKSKDISAIVLNIDSPGGTVDGTETLANIVKNTEKPVVSFLNGLMASAALWIGSSADEIMASNEMDEIGSVGVLLSFADVQPYWEKKGVKFHQIVSTLSPEKVKQFEDIRAGKYDDYKKEVLDPLAERFQNVIRENRPKVKDEHLTGKVFFAKDVKGVFVDSIGTIEDAIALAASLVKEKTKAESGNSNNNNQTQSIQMKKLELINKVLGISDLEMVDGHASLNEEMLEALENTLAERNSAVETAQTALQDATAVIDGIDESVAKAETIEDKAQAVVNYVEEVRETPAGSGEELSPKGDPKNTDGDSCTVKDTDTDLEAIEKIAEEFNVKM